MLARWIASTPLDALALRAPPKLDGAWLGEAWVGEARPGRTWLGVEEAGVLVLEFHMLTTNVSFPDWRTYFAGEDAEEVVKGKTPEVQLVFEPPLIVI